MPYSMCASKGQFDIEIIGPPWTMTLEGVMDQTIYDIVTGT
jgi:hypothetical protein